jgi:hypothetical protein
LSTDATAHREDAYCLLPNRAAGGTTKTQAQAKLKLPAKFKRAAGLPTQAVMKGK